MTDFYLDLDGITECVDCGDYDGTVVEHAASVHGDEFGKYVNINE